MRCQMETYLRAGGHPHRCHRSGRIHHVPFAPDVALCRQHGDKYRRHPDIYRESVHDEDFWALHGQSDPGAR